MLKLKITLTHTLLVSGLFFNPIISGLVIQNPENRQKHPVGLEQKNNHEQSIQGSKNLDGPIFLHFDQTLPAEVLKTKTNSLVAVRSAIAHLRNDQAEYDYFHAVGFSVWDNFVVTVLHLFGEYPANWEANKEENPRFLKILVSDGQKTFSAKLRGLDYRKDLALLEVLPNHNPEVNFSKQPVNLASSTWVQDSVSKQPRVPYEKFYIFAFSSQNSSAYFSLEIGPYRSLTNYLMGNVLEFPLGLIQGGAEEGFSGSPLVAPDGKVMGVVSQTSPAFTRVITLEALIDFLESAKSYQNQKH